MKYALLFQLISVLALPSWGQNSLIEKAKSELHNKNIEKSQAPQSRSPLLNIQLKNNAAEEDSQKSIAFAFGFFQNQSDFYHPTFQNKIDKSDFENSPLLSLIPQWQLVNFSFLKQNLSLGLSGNLSYTQMKKRFENKGNYDDLRLSHYSYGAGPLVKWHSQLFKSKIELQAAFLYQYEYQSLSSASNELKFTKRTLDNFGYLSFRYFITDNYFADLQKTINQESNSWNFALGTFL